MIAAMMTAANLGARVTGWGFVIFTVGSIGWSILGVATGQTNLLATNLFLTLVNFIGIWRWLGRQRAYEDGGKSAKQASRKSAAPTLFTATGLAGMTAEGEDGVPLGKAVEALIECASGAVSYIVISSGGIDERLRAIPRDRVKFGGDRLRVMMPKAAFEALPTLETGDWPAQAVA